jgi:hypothetical protein
MVVKFTDAVEDVWQPDEYHDFVQAEIDLSDFDSLCDSAWTLKALANNRTFFSDAINNELKAYLDGGTNPGFTAYSLILFNARSYTIRANIWAPLDAEPSRRQLQATAFSYFAAHDHNFHFVTAGYLGGGYETVLYRRQFEGDRGCPGSAAKLQYLEHARLRQGDLMAYRAFEDVHAQLPPDEVSISLNLMAHPPEFADQRQYFFDMERQIIATPVGDGYETFRTFIRMAQHVGNPNTIDMLLALARTHSVTTIREAALEQLLALCPGDADHFLSSCRVRPDPNLIAKISGKYYPPAGTLSQVPSAIASTLYTGHGGKNGRKT